MVLQNCLFLQHHCFLFLSTISANKYVIIRKKPRFFLNFYFSSNKFFEQYKKNPVMRGQTMVGLPLWNIPRTTGGLLSPRDPFAQVAATSSARCLAFLTLKRAHTRPYTILRQAVKSPSNAGWLRSSTVGFAEPFRSVCRNVSGKLPSHPFAALTGLAAAPRCCWLASFCLKVLQQPILNYHALQIIEPVALLEDFGRPTGVFFEE